MEIDSKNAFSNLKVFLSKVLYGRLLEYVVEDMNLKVFFLHNPPISGTCFYQDNVWLLLLC